jgi:ABC-type glycerol-3-phosphate transport system substrate-binding protein
MSRRAFMHMAGLGAAGAVLAACGPTATSTPTSAPVATDVPATTAPTAAAATAVPTDVPATAAPTAEAVATEGMKQLQGEIVVSHWHQGSGSPSELAQQMLTDAYHQFQPDVNIVWEVQVGGGDYATWLGTQLAAGTPRPDIVSTNYQPTYDKYVDFVTYRDAINPYTGRKWSEDLDFDFFAPAATSIDVLATQQTGVNWFYNTDLFDQAGVTAVPTTWEEWLDACDKILTKTGVTPIAMHQYMLMQWGGEVYFDQYHRDWVEFARALPGDWNYNPEKDDAFVYDPTDKDLNRKFTFSIQRLLKNLKEGAITYADDQMTDLLTNWAKMAPYFNSDFWSGIDTYARFIQGQSAMFPLTFPTFWTLQTDLTKMDAARREALGLDPDANPDFGASAFNWPSMTGPLVIGPARGIESYQGEYLGAIDKSPEKSEVDVDFLMFWLSKAGYQPWVDGFAQSDLWTPSGKLLVRDVNVPEKYASVINAVKPLGNAEAAPNGFLMWTYGGLGTLWQKESEEMIKNVLAGTLDPAEFGPRYQEMLTETYWTDVLAELKLTEDEVLNPQLEPNS